MLIIRRGLVGGRLNDREEPDRGGEWESLGGRAALRHSLALKGRETWAHKNVLSISLVAKQWEANTSTWLNSFYHSISQLPKVCLLLNPNKSLKYFLTPISRLSSGSTGTRSSSSTTRSGTDMCQRPTASRGRGSMAWEDATLRMLLKWLSHFKIR